MLTKDKPRVKFENIFSREGHDDVEFVSLQLNRSDGQPMWRSDRATPLDFEGDIEFSQFILWRTLEQNVRDWDYLTEMFE